MKKNRIAFAITALMIIASISVGCASGTTAATSGSIDLKTLSVSTGTLDPSFSPDVTDYTVSVPFSVSEITVTYETLDLYAGVGFNAINPVSLDVGDNELVVTVTADDYLTDPDPAKIKRYYLTITRAAQ